MKLGLMILLPFIAFALGYWTGADPIIENEAPPAPTASVASSASAASEQSTTETNSREEDFQKLRSEHHTALRELHDCRAEASPDTSRTMPIPPAPVGTPTFAVTEFVTPSPRLSQLRSEARAARVAISNPNEVKAFLAARKINDPDTAFKSLHLIRDQKKTWLPTLFMKGQFKGQIEKPGSWAGTQVALTTQMSNKLVHLGYRGRMALRLTPSKGGIVTHTTKGAVRILEMPDGIRDGFFLEGNGYVLHLFEFPAMKMLAGHIYERTPKESAYAGKITLTSM